MNSKKLKFGIGIGVIIVAVLVLAIQGIQTDETLSYSKSVGEVFAMGSDAQRMSLKVNGELKQGSVNLNGTELDFVMTEGDQELPVHYIGLDPIPDTFNNDMEAEVVVSGKLGSDGIFKAERIQAKCASKYEADYSGEWVSS